MRSSIFNVPAGTAGIPLVVNSPTSNFPSLTGVVANIGAGEVGINSIVGYPSGTVVPQAYVGASMTYNALGGGTYNGTITTVPTSTAQPRQFDVTPAPVAPVTIGEAVTIGAVTRVNSLPIGTTVIPVQSTSGVTVGDTITAGGGIANNTTIIAIGTTTTASGVSSPAVTLSVPTNAVITTGTTITIPAQSAYLVYPVDQYVTPVELSIQPLSTGGASVSVQATVVPLSEVDGPNVFWGTYNSDGGTGNLGAQGTVNTYSGKVVTAIRFANASTNVVTVALAEGGIIS